ncbi:VOC family protein [Streptomyces sp. TLI_171]|uniref:VOC family protein n=1 Tax=Streptomyces sp. TLI_171 TaxID=1938859 RepID=UPI000C19BE9D|nr:VOC family protein [Streptomyces sp. TLI_171]RKE18285.1 putative enzyme related to lactoylglutathione lyase [Streptomyces sp. TLI_171]
MLLGLRTVIYPVADLAAAKAWWSGVLGVEPYFDEPFYVGFNVGGYELALLPDGDPAAGPVTYWGVRDVDAAVERFVAAGATVREAVQEVGGGIRVATVVEPAGAAVGLIENPVFVLPEKLPGEGDGPGR